MIPKFIVNLFKTIAKEAKLIVDKNEPSWDGRRKSYLSPCTPELHDTICKGCGKRIADHEFKTNSTTARWEMMKRIYDLQTCAPLPEGWSLHSEPNGFGKCYTYWACSDEDDQDAFFKQKRVCEGCGHKYKKPIRWIADFRADCQNPKGCGWMIFKDGTQTFD